ncbi:MAG: HisA/HisF-related TIM barrel protein [Promethearchaeota archaeon]
MREFNIIPVLDILNSVVVHAVRGERDDYKPLKSNLFHSSNPLEILNVLKNNFKFVDIYIADLDAIINKKPNFTLLSEILQISGLDIIIDPGIINSSDIQRFSQYSINKIIIGLETIQSLDVVKEALSLLGHNRLIVSIDMYKETVLTEAKGLINKTPLEIINLVETIGIKELILLDLFRVGQKIGGIPPHYLNIRDSFNGNIYVGGGIKDYEDILSYKQHNFTGVLIATALYDGTINIEKVRKIID